MTSITRKLQGKSFAGPGWDCYIALPLILLAPFIVFIKFHGYPFAQPEVLWVIFGITLFGLACGALTKKLGTLGQAILIACLLEFSLDSVGNFQLKGKLISGIAVFIFVWVLRDKAAKVLALTFSAFIAATFVFPSENLLPSLKNSAVGPGKTGLPPVVHLILDAHIGAEGIPQGIGMGSQFKNDFISFYADNGFRLYGKAYSQYQLTIDSIFSLINFETGLEADNDRIKKHRRSDFANEITRNKYFQEMTAIGYKIKVYQTTAMNYCQEKFRVASCYTYPTFSTRFLEDLPANTSAKAWVLISSFLFRSDFIRTLNNGYWHLANFIERISGLALPFPWSWDGRRTSPIEASRALEKLRDDLRSSPQGITLIVKYMKTRSLSGHWSATPRISAGKIPLPPALKDIKCI